MRTILILTLLAIAMAAPLISADPNVQTGEQTGYYWSESTFVPVQAGSNFVLAGAIGDHDIFFYNADGGLVGMSLACGPEFGSTVPDTAVTGEILVWDHDSVPTTCTSAGVVPSSQWVYVDGF